MSYIINEHESGPITYICNDMMSHPRILKPHKMGNTLKVS